MLRVLHVYRTFFPDPPGGIAEAMRQICRATAQHGVENTVFALSPQPQPAEIEVDGIRVVRSLSWWAPASCDLGGPDSFRRFQALAATTDVVHFYFPWPFADVLRLAALPRGKATVLTYISDIVRQRYMRLAYTPLMHATLRSMSAIVSNAPEYATTSPVLSIPEFASRVSIIPLGIVEEGYWPGEDVSTLHRYGLKADGYFLFVGVLRYYKGLHFLIKAAGATGLKVVIAGDGPEGPSLRRLAADIGARNVVFVGRINDAEKQALIRGCRAFVLPSHLRSEAFGMVLVEASMLGKPLISCSISSGTSFINSHRLTGIVVEASNAEALGAAMAELEHNADRARMFGAAARRRYLSVFSGPALGRGYAEIFKKVAMASTGIDEN